MSFVGDLEHLPIVDVIQLLHATRKSGTLCLKSSKGESQLVFSDGCIVSANHSNNSVRIGQILVQMNAITKGELDNTLNEQKNAGSNRVPLIASLIESGKIKKEDAFKGLETLIEMTIVEVLTWTEGTFELDVETTVVSDEYRYIPEKLKLDLHLNTQNVLMDALRIYDEKKRDGTLMDETFPEEESFEPAHSPAGESQVISIDDLGLDVLDDLEKVIPGFFTPVKVYDPATVHRERIGRQLEELPPSEQERLLSFLVSQAEQANGATPHAASPHAVILFSDSEFISHTVITACKHDGLLTFSTDEEENLELIINQTFLKKLLPVLVIDQSASDRGKIDEQRCASLIAHVREHYPGVAIFLLTGSGTYATPLHAMKSGVRAVLPKPNLSSRPSTFAQDTISFLDVLKACIQQVPLDSNSTGTKLFTECINALGGLKELADITAVLDRYASETLARAVTFVMRKSEMVGENLRTATECRRINVTLPSPTQSQIQTLLADGHAFFGQLSAPEIETVLYPAIGRPATGESLLLPLKCLGRVLAITYADFGMETPAPVQLEHAEILARHAGLVYENSLYRKKFEQMLQAQH